MTTPILGGQSVDVANPVDGQPDRWNTPTTTYPWVTVSGVRFRPLNMSETVEMYDRNEQVWKLTAPPDPAILALQPNGVVRYEGSVYEIDGGIKPFPGPDGEPFKVTVLCKRQQREIA